VIRFGNATTPTTGRDADLAVTEPIITREQLEPLLERFRRSDSADASAIFGQESGWHAATADAQNIAVELAGGGDRAFAGADGVRRRGSTDHGELLGGERTALASARSGRTGAMRALCEDAGAHALGDFTLEQARTMAETGKPGGEGRLEEALIPSARLFAEFPSGNRDLTTAGFIRQGRDFPRLSVRVRPGSQYVKAISPEGQLVAIGEASCRSVSPIVVL